MKKVKLRKVKWPEWNQADVYLEDDEKIVGVFETTQRSQGVGIYEGGWGGGYHRPDTQCIYLVIAKEEPDDTARI